MNCPACQKELPPRYDAGWCPFCGKNLPESAIYSPASLPPESLPQYKINWAVFFGLLLTPPVATLLSAMANQNRNQGVSPAIAIFGGALAGIICGIMLGLRFGRSTFARLVIGVILAFVMGAVCIVLCFFGCIAGNYRWSFN